MGIEGFSIYTVSPWALKKLDQSHYLWQVFTSAKYISKPEDWKEVQWYFRQSKVLEAESKEDILHILEEGRIPEFSLETSWGLLHFYLSADWWAYNNEWQHRKQFRDSSDRSPIISYHPTNNLLILDVFTTATYTSHDRYVSYYTLEEVQQIDNALKMLFTESFESRLNQIERLGRDVTIFRGNEGYYFSQYFDRFLEFYGDVAEDGNAVILQAIC